MTIEFTIICDWCGRVVAGSVINTARARRDVTDAGGKTSLPAGKDLCGTCVEKGVKPPI